MLSLFFMDYNNKSQSNKLINTYIHKYWYLLILYYLYVLFLYLLYIINHDNKCKYYYINNIKYSIYKKIINKYEDIFSLFYITILCSSLNLSFPQRIPRCVCVIKTCSSSQLPCVSHHLQQCCHKWDEFWERYTPETLWQWPKAGSQSFSCQVLCPQPLSSGWTCSQICAFPEYCRNKQKNKLWM